MVPWKSSPNAVGHDKHGEIWNYRFVNDVPLRAGEDATSVNWCELVITHETSSAILYKNAFVTNHTLRGCLISQNMLP